MYLLFKYVKVKRQFAVGKVKSTPKIMEEVLRVAIPISFGAAVGTIMSLIDSILVPQKLLEAGFDTKEATVLYAQLTGKASVLINIPLTLSVALGVSLIPIIAEKYVLRDVLEVSRKVDTAIKMSLVIALPSFLGLFFMAEPVMKLIFPGRYDGFEILKYLSISIPFIVLAQTTTSILQGTGSYFLPVVNLLIGCVIKVILTLTFVPIHLFNVYGAVIATIGAYVVSSALNVISMHVRLRVSINYKDALIKPAIAALIMTNIVMITYLKFFQLFQSNGIACLISIFMGIIIYVLLIVIFGVFKYEYIKNKIIKRHK